MGDQDGYRLVGDFPKVAWLRPEIIEEVAAIEVHCSKSRNESLTRLQRRVVWYRYASTGIPKATSCFV